MQEAEGLIDQPTAKFTPSRNNNESELSDTQTDLRSDNAYKNVGITQRESGGEFYFPKLIIAGSALSINFTDSVERLRDTHTDVDNTINALNLMMATSFDDVDSPDGYATIVSPPQLMNDSHSYTALQVSTPLHESLMTSQQDVTSQHVPSPLASLTSLQMSITSLDSVAKQSSASIQSSDMRNKSAVSSQAMSSSHSSSKAMTSSASSPSLMFSSSADDISNDLTFVAMYAFSANGDGQIDLAPNDVLVVCSGEEGGLNGWMIGENRRTCQSGWFPMTHVREGISPTLAQKKTVVNTNRPVIQPKPKGERPLSLDMDEFEEEFDEIGTTGDEYCAIYPYRGQQDGDLSFLAGDIILTYERQDSGWWRGTCKGREGWFPGNYVQAMPGDAATPNGLPALFQSSTSMKSDTSKHNKKISTLNARSQSETGSHHHFTSSSSKKDTQHRGITLPTNLSAHSMAAYSDQNLNGNSFSSTKRRWRPKLAMPKFLKKKSRTASITTPEGEAQKQELFAPKTSEPIVNGVKGIPKARSASVPTDNNGNNISRLEEQISAELALKKETHISDVTLSGTVDSQKRLLTADNSSKIVSVDPVLNNSDVFDKNVVHTVEKHSYTDTENVYSEILAVSPPVKSEALPTSASGDSYLNEIGAVFKAEENGATDLLTKSNLSSVESAKQLNDFASAPGHNIETQITENPNDNNTTDANVNENNISSIKVVGTKPSTSPSSVISNTPSGKPTVLPSTHLNNSQYKSIVYIDSSGGLQKLESTTSTISISSPDKRSITSSSLATPVLTNSGNTSKIKGSTPVLLDSISTSQIKGSTPVLKDSTSTSMINGSSPVPTYSVSTPQIKASTPACTDSVSTSQKKSSTPILTDSISSSHLTKANASSAHYPVVLPSVEAIPEHVSPLSCRFSVNMSGLLLEAPAGFSDSFNEEIDDMSLMSTATVEPRLGLPAGLNTSGKKSESMIKLPDFMVNLPESTVDTPESVTSIPVFTELSTSTPTPVSTGMSIRAPVSTKNNSPDIKLNRLRPLPSSSVTTVGNVSSVSVSSIGSTSRSQSPFISMHLVGNKIKQDYTQCLSMSNLALTNKPKTYGAKPSSNPANTPSSTSTERNANIASHVDRSQDFSTPHENEIEINAALQTRGVNSDQKQGLKSTSSSILQSDGEKVNLSERGLDYTLPPIKPFDLNTEDEVGVLNTRALVEEDTPRLSSSSNTKQGISLIQKYRKLFDPQCQIEIDYSTKQPSLDLSSKRSSFSLDENKNLKSIADSVVTVSTPLNLPPSKSGLQIPDDASTSSLFKNIDPTVLNSGSASSQWVDKALDTKVQVTPHYNRHKLSQVSLGPSSKPRNDSASSGLSIPRDVLEYHGRSGTPSEMKYSPLRLDAGRTNSDASKMKQSDVKNTIAKLQNNGESGKRTSWSNLTPMNQEDLIKQQVFRGSSEQRLVSKVGDERLAHSNSLKKTSVASDNRSATSQTFDTSLPISTPSKVHEFISWSSKDKSSTSKSSKNSSDKQSIRSAGLSGRREKNALNVEDETIKVMTIASVTKNTDVNHNSSVRWLTTPIKISAQEQKNLDIAATSGKKKVSDKLGVASGPGTISPGLQSKGDFVGEGSLTMNNGMVVDSKLTNGIDNHSFLMNGSVSDEPEEILLNSQSKIKVYEMLSSGKQNDLSSSNKLRSTKDKGSAMKTKTNQFTNPMKLIQNQDTISDVKVPNRENSSFFGEPKAKFLNPGQNSTTPLRGDVPFQNGGLCLKCSTDEVNSSPDWQPTSPISPSGSNILKFFTPASFTNSPLIRSISNVEPSTEHPINSPVEGRVSNNSQTTKAGGHLMHSSSLSSQLSRTSGTPLSTSEHSKVTSHMQCTHSVTNHTVMNLNSLAVFDEDEVGEESMI